MSIVTAPASLGTFLQFYVDGSLAPAHIILALPSFLTAFTLAAGKKTLRKLARFVFTDRRDPGTTRTAWKAAAIGEQSDAYRIALPSLGSSHVYHLPRGQAWGAEVSLRNCAELYGVLAQVGE